MKYYEVKCVLNPFSQEAADLLSATLSEIGFEAFSVTEDGLTAYIQQSEWDEDKMRQSVQDFFLPDVGISYSCAVAPDEDWNQVWEEEGFQPVVIGDEVVVHDVKHTDVPPAKYDILITPRLAFGTGSHQTTRLILRTLACLDLEGKHVVDAGTGTGILAIVAAKCGAREAIAYDIDEWSVENTLHNAELNDVSCITALCGDSSVLSHVSGVFDVVLANINRNILLADMRHFAEVLATDGTLILSGFYEEDVALITTEAQKHGLHPVGTTTENHWACVAFKR